MFHIKDIVKTGILGHVSVKTKIFAGFIGIGVIPVLIAGLIINFVSTQRITGNAFLVNKEISSSIAGEVDAMMEGRVNTLKTAAESHMMKTMTLEHQQREMLALAKQYPDISNVFLATSDGQQVYRTEGTLASIADRDYFRTLINTKQTVVSDVLISKGTGKPAVVIAAPIINDEQIVGILGSVVDLTRLEEIVNRNKIGRNGFVFIVDKTGRALAYPDESTVKDQKNLTDLSIVAKAMANKNGTDLYTDKGKEFIGGFSEVPLTHWLVFVTESKEDALHIVDEIRNIILLSVLVIAVLAVMIAFTFSKKLTGPLNELVDVSEKVAKGNLNVKIHVASQDETGRLGAAFNIMVEQLRHLVNQVAASAQKVASMSEELSASSEEAAQAVESVAMASSSTAEGSKKASDKTKFIAETVDQTAKTMQSVVEEAVAAHQLSGEMNKNAKQGKEATANVIGTIKEVQDSISSTAVVVDTLGEKSRQIGNIVDMISEIASQTNLLALNAAIEAARAGEAGRGFAVVAEEVRKLAEQSQEAAKQIYDIIQEIQSQTMIAVDSMSAGVKKVDEGVSVVDKTAVTLDNILDKVEQAVDMIEEITEKIKHQEQSFVEISNSIKDIDRIAVEANDQAQNTAAASEETTASIQQISASAQSLAQTANELTVLISKFKL